MFSFFSILTTSMSFKMIKYNLKKLTFVLNIIKNNEKILLQYSLKTEMSKTVMSIKEVIIVTAIKSIKLKI